MSSFCYKEERLNLSTPGEFFVRLVVYAAYAVISTGTFLMFFSDVRRLQWLAIILASFLIDRLIHFNGRSRTIFELKGENINLAEVVTPPAYRALSYAFRKSLAVQGDFYLILLKELAERDDITEALRRLDVVPRDFVNKIESYLTKPSKQAALDRSQVLKLIESLVITAYESAANTGEKFIETRNLFVALTSVPYPPLVKIFELFDLSTVDVQETVIFGRWRKLFAGVSRLPAVFGGFITERSFLRHRVMNRAWTARPTPTLDQFGTDLTELAERESIGFLIGHDKEFAQIMDVISRPGKPNVLLVGEPGVGKSTIIAHLAFLMTKDEVPPVLFDKRLVSLEITDLIANATPEILAGRLKKIIEEILLAGNIVLFIPNIHDFFRTGEAKSMNAIDIILPVLKSDAIPTIGETFPREFKQFIDSRTDFLDQFEVVSIDEINDAEALRFMIYSSLILEKDFGVFITFRAIRKSVDIAKRYFRNKVLPGSALDLLKQAAAKAKQDGLKSVDEDVVMEVAERQSKVPIQRAGVIEAEKLLNLESVIHEKLINQESAVKAVAQALREYRSGLTRKGGPIASFLFVGPTGVGKTELAKILTQTQFGSKDMMSRFDMSEYQDKQSIFRFIGTPDGQKSGALTDAVLKSPYGLVLLDEFEKAHPDILNIFLQVFDDGRLTDSLGRTVSFENTIIIATSNAHSEFIKTEIEKGRTSEEVAEELKKKLTEYFKPELLNRFSDVIVFRNLKEEEILRIAGIMTNEVADILMQNQGVELDIDDSAVKKIAELGYSPVFGARPLRQVVSEKMKSVLADKILRKEISRGTKMRFVFENGEFEFKIID